MNINKIKTYADNWAYDLSKKFSSEGEIVNEKVIDQSIEFILATIMGQRLFNPGFGSNFRLRVFDTMDEDFLEVLLNDTIVAIKRWEDRITIDERASRITLDISNNSAFILIPYIINERQIKSEFKKKITQ